MEYAVFFFPTAIASVWFAWEYIRYEKAKRQRRLSPLARHRRSTAFLWLGMSLIVPLTAFIVRRM